jgi:CRP-like cAMP-binding protein
MVAQAVTNAFEIENELLAGLPSEELKRLLPALQTVSLSRGQTLYQSGEKITHVYFPFDSVIAFTVIEEKSSVAVGLVGREGLICVGALAKNNRSPFHYVAHLSGGAMKLPTEILQREFKRNVALQNAVLNFNNALLMRLSQSGFCHRRHTLEQRLARWLLMLCNRARRDDLPLTQEFLSKMLGARRAGVTIALGAFRDGGLIEMKRSHIHILDRERLEASACECYHIIEGRDIVH